MKKNGEWFVLDLRLNGHPLQPPEGDRLDDYFRQLGNSALISPGGLSCVGEKAALQLSASIAGLLGNLRSAEPLAVFLKRTKTFSCTDALLQDDEPVRPPLDNLKPADAVSLRSRMFAGPVADFITKLPGYVRNAASEGGIDPGLFDTDTQAIQEAVRICASITPTTIRTVTDRYGGEDVGNLVSRLR